MKAAVDVYGDDAPAKLLRAIARPQVWLSGLGILGLAVLGWQFSQRPDWQKALAFAVTARPLGEPPRIGSRGTAKLYGQWVPLSYSLLRRPLTAARQFIGL